MVVRNCSGRFVMRIDWHQPPVLAWLVALLAACPFSWAAEAPPSDQMNDLQMSAVLIESSPLPVPPEAESAYQDLVTDNVQEIWLEEAVFTEISPLTIPEVGIVLPPDQAL